MLELGVVPHILDLLEKHVDEGDVSVQHAGLSALRNLAIPGNGRPSPYNNLLNTFDIKPKICYERHPLYLTHMLHILLGL